MILLILTRKKRKMPSAAAALQSPNGITKAAVAGTDIYSDFLRLKYYYKNNTTELKCQPFFAENSYLKYILRGEIISYTAGLHILPNEQGGG